MSISLNPTQEQFVLSKIESGKYANVDEVIYAAFKLLEEQEQEYSLWLNETQKKVEVGFAEIERGEVLDTELVINQLKDKLRQKREAQT
ncbi:MAG: type II toxin-antitoxin system ParD family antitoxin [Aulosira sp. ZfuVER01]|nr:type II toxin-antitoxin system ParD family antitoxin [Aulosira sp. ZfuVER01]MDZ7999553.1 type II toxin-antitoxin system ParD family antitoxin [Aulosira sp. DedVER01a]MDZ8053968.1 type II toxin-antitoxin system ParD family antitoxin [Aulosira sp. ZfuCHP01]